MVRPPRVSELLGGVQPLLGITRVYRSVAVRRFGVLPTELFVDVRDLLMAPQFAAYDGWQALLTGNPTTIANAVGSGVNEVVGATVHFPLAVTQNLVDAVGNASLGVTNPFLEAASL